ncbi:sigma-70 family RNA polymerase sigma factor [Moorena producens JHB]|uniref:Sigma-70 family RNA polymerase sigma factor n=1 Tax=Moorena producens (strain JHB) TaxID=1454205 RepID=A0A1D9G5B1_MOOP1|nr:sigma-70 family RNA polymerase sigma factor [Moorena producens]AOY82773.2 sigma-70 family RNA polymerase sigma factor [Moorena producens JHB]
MISDIQLEASSTALGQSHHFSQKEFWQQWQQYQDYLYRRCLRWMGGNPTDAEDALSRAMLKAWEKVKKFAGKIANFKAWLTRLTHNLCVDIHREHCRSANHVEDIEGIPEEQGLLCCNDTPERALETDEKKIAIRRAIDNLPARLHQTFILHFYQELSYRDIAQQQEISYQNVCKRISQARAILREELRGYFIGEDETDPELSVTPTNQATESAIGEMSQSNAEVESIVGETVTSSVAVEEVESVVGEEVQEVVRSPLARQSPSVQHSESVPIAAISEEKLEVNNEALLRGGMNMKRARWLFHQYGCSTNMAISPIWPFHQYGHSTKMAVPPRWLFHQDGCFTKMAVPPRWLFHQDGHFTNMAISPRCPFHQDGHFTKMPVPPRWPFHQDGHSAARCPPQKTLKIIPHLYNVIPGLSFLITICSNFHPVKLRGRPCLIME